MQVCWEKEVSLTLSPVCVCVCVVCRGLVHRVLWCVSAVVRGKVHASFPSACYLSLSELHHIPYSISLFLPVHSLSTTETPARPPCGTHGYWGLAAAVGPRDMVCRPTLVDMPWHLSSTAALACGWVWEDKRLRKHTLTEKQCVSSTR